ncbi:MAG: HEAT repeat domain-containing protein [bacterium]|nr:HEAT repeat domain-containing protein [bacterium]
MKLSHLASFSLLAMSLASVSTAQCPYDPPGGGPTVPPPPAPGFSPQPSPPADPAPPAPTTPGPSSPNPAGPGPATPPGGGPDIPGAPPTGPATPGPSSPATPGGPQVPLGGSVTPSDIPLDDFFDLEAWELWWRHNSDPYLRFELFLDRVRPETGREGEGQVDSLSKRRAGLTYGVVYKEIVPALLQVLEKETDTRLVRQAMLALARVGDRPIGHEPQAPFALTLLPFVADGNRAVAETAVMALGVLGSIEAADALAALAGDTDRGHELCRTSRVPVRIRAFAAYGLGLVGQQADRPELARFAMHHLAKVLSEDAKEYADLQAACVIGMGIVRLPVSGTLVGDDARPSTSLETQIEHLLSILGSRKSSEEAKAYVPTALANLLGATESLDLKSRVAKALIDRSDKRAKVKDSVRRSSLMALGHIGDADGDSVDRAIRTALMQAVPAKDGIARRFALIAIAEVGSRPGSGDGDPFEASEECAKFLSRNLARGKSRLKPWSGLALGVLGSGLKQHGRLLSRGAADALLHMTGDTKNPQDLAAYALGAGLIGDNRARRNLIERMEKIHDSEYMARMSVAFGLMGDRSALPLLVDTMDEAHTRPEVMERAAIGRALLGDRELVPDLVDRLENGCDCWASMSGVCRALAWAGDARAVPPLLNVLKDEQETGLNRSLVISSLGRIADRSKLPWHSRISVGINYTAAPPTLTDPTGFGVLDTL